MNNMKKRVFAALLAAAMTLPAFACGEKINSGDDSSSKESSISQDESSAENSESNPDESSAEKKNDNSSQEASESHTLAACSSRDCKASFTLQEIRLPYFM